MGIIFIMVHQMLILFSIFAERSSKTDIPLALQSSQRATAAFAFILFFNYSIFGGLLAVFRDDIIKEGKLRTFCQNLCSHSHNCFPLLFRSVG